MSFYLYNRKSIIPTEIGGSKLARKMELIYVHESNIDGIGSALCQIVDGVASARKIYPDEYNELERKGYSATGGNAFKILKSKWKILTFNELEQYITSNDWFVSDNNPDCGYILSDYWKNVEQ